MRYVAVLMLIAGGLVLAALNLLSESGPLGSRRYVLVAVLLLLAAWFAACAVMYLAAVGFGAQMGRLVKRLDGRERLGLNWLLLGPSTVLSLGTRLYIQLASYESTLAPIDDRLYLGRLPLPGEIDDVREAGISAVVDLCAELPEVDFLRRLPAGQYLAVPVLDGFTPTFEQLLIITDWVTGMLQRGHRVLLHCALGHGRSAVAAACTLLRLGRVETTDQAVAWLEKHRPRVSLHRGQTRAVRAFAARAGELEISSGRG